MVLSTLSLYKMEKLYLAREARRGVILWTGCREGVKKGENVVDRGRERVKKGENVVDRG